VLTGKGAPDLRTTIGGQDIDLPVLLAPTGLTGLVHWTGDLGAAQAAERAGTLTVASSGASHSHEEIAEGTEPTNSSTCSRPADLTD
jgi:L-lactate dehydrogenase (cytochrome)/(S)-mandelate dehydrogenase